ncbi:unnamed protein product [Phytomonas sp. EM1]|nr:unnamed protein product [Phytomonas sp. EM1]|eukprot:CCW60458.1 unnamed protein product [Phytomonas sp. isolate EM1]
MEGTTIDGKVKRDYTLIASVKRKRSLSSQHELMEEVEQHTNEVMQQYKALVAQSSASGNGASVTLVPNINEINNRYRKLVKIGEGSFGEVFIVYDTVAGTYLTMKRMIRFLHSSERSLFGLHNTTFRELHLLTTLSHPNIVRAIDYHILSNGTLIVFMPVISYDLVSLMRHWQNITASGRVTSAWRMPLPVIKCIFRQLLEAVAYLHRHKVIHRDLKPSNVMVDMDGVLKLIDFGWSRYLATDLNQRLTGPPCTVNYRPPELLLLGCHATRYQTPLDIWCCGCILFEMLSGGTLFVSGHNEVEAISSIFDWLGSPSPKSNTYSREGSHSFVIDFPLGKPNTFASRCASLSIQPREVEFMSKMLQLEPSERLRAEKLAQDEWFSIPPSACRPPDLMLPAHNTFRWLEWKRRKSHHI